MNALLFHPVLPWPLLVVAMLAGVGLIGWSLVVGLRSPGRMLVLAALRLVALGALVFALIQPQEQRELVTILRPQVAVLVDDSASMNDPVDDGQPRRAERVREFLDSPAMGKARESFDFHVFTLDQTEISADKAPPASTANASNIVTGLGTLEKHLRGQPLAAVLLLSDGLDTSGIGKAEGVADAVPVETFELEKPFTPKPHTARISIAGVDFPPRVVVGWHSDLRVSIAGSGLSGQSVPVELWRDGTKIGDGSTAFNEDEQTRQVNFPVTHDRAGTEQYEVRVTDPAADKEARAYPFSINVQLPGKRVLYIQNQLGFEFKFLRKAIAANRNLQLSSFTRWADGRLVNLDDRSGQPATLDLSPGALAANAVVILGDLAPDSLPVEDWRNLHDFVDKGGGLVLLGGPASFPSGKMGQTALADLLPVRGVGEFREGSFPVEPTESGLHSPVFGPVFAQVKTFPPLLSVDVAGGVAPSAETLMNTLVNGQPHPLVASVRFGKGRVVAMLSDTLWRWRLGAAPGRADLSPYDLFWTQLLDWMVPKEQENHPNNSIDLFTERASYVLGEKPEVRAVVQTTDGKQPGSLALRVKTPDDKTFDYTMRPGVLQTREGKSVRGFVATMELNATGIFRATARADLGGGKAEAEVRFVVTRPATELTGKPIDRDLLRRIAAVSKGHYYALGQWNDWPTDLHVEEQHTSRLELADLWNRPWLLGLMMSTLAADWIVRKVWHLP